MLTVSRIDPRKGLRAMPSLEASLVAAGINATSEIVGPTIGLIGDSEQDAIRFAAASAGVGDRVRLSGAIALDRLLPLYREYDIFVLPTRPGEGIPRVLLESMAAGLPIVTTRVAGITSLVAHEENGLLVDEGPQEQVEEQLAAAVRRLIETPALRQRLIQGGYATARAHTLERQAAELMAAVNGAFALNRSSAA
jgi:glycosyltransferase involved in cell wall biosynthesis